MDRRRGHRVTVTAAATVALFAAAAVAIVAQPVGAYQRPGVTELVRCDPGNLGSHQATNSLSATGRYLAFESGCSHRSYGSRVGQPGLNVHVRDGVTGAVELVSVSSAGTPGVSPPAGRGSVEPHISAKGRFVVFRSDAINLVPGDTNGSTDVFVRDLKNGTTKRVSVASDGSEAEPPAPTDARNLVLHVKISGNGRFVSFESRARNLTEDTPEGAPSHLFVHDRRTRDTELVTVDGSSAGWASLNHSGRYVLVTVRGQVDTQVYVHDRRTGKNELVSVSLDGTPASFGASTPIPTGGDDSISADGRTVVFWSDSPHLVPNGGLRADPNLGSANRRTYVRDLDTGRTERVDVSSAGEDTEPPSLPNTSGQTISASGRYVAFHSAASNLSGEVEDTSLFTFGDPDVFLHDRRTGATEYISIGFDGTQGTDDQLLGYKGFSGDGRYVSFASNQDNLVRDYTTGDGYIFVRDRGFPLRVGELVVSGEARALSLDGAPRFSRSGTVWIDDPTADALTSRLGAAGELLGARLTYRPLLKDMFVVLELDRMSRTPELAAATAGSVYGMSLTLDGTAYEIRAASTGVGPHGETTAAFGLFDCSSKPLCTKVSELRGGFGTTGERITFSVPIEDLGVQDGSVISDVQAFSALGNFLGGPPKVVDEAVLAQ